MNILAFDTCFDGCSVCIARARADGVVELASAFERFETGHAERLVPMIGAAMEQAGLGFREIDRIAVTVGPGTFTGTRIGVAAARGLALATGVALVGASSLAVMAEVAARALGTREGDLAIAVDARRGEVYVQLFGAGGGLYAKSQPAVLPIAEAARIGGGGPLVVAGSGAEAVAAAAVREGRRVRACLTDLLPDARALAHMAAVLDAAEGPLVPLYLRPPDAKPQDGKAVARA